MANRFVIGLGHVPKLLLRSQLSKFLRSANVFLNSIGCYTCSHDLSRYLFKISFHDIICAALTSVPRSIAELRPFAIAANQLGMGDTWQSFVVLGFISDKGSPIAAMSPGRPVVTACLADGPSVDRTCLCVGRLERRPGEIGWAARMHEGVSALLSHTSSSGPNFLN
jgi:hypothetical protein